MPWQGLWRGADRSFPFALFPHSAAGRQWSRCGRAFLQCAHLEMRIRFARVAPCVASTGSPGRSKGLQVVGGRSGRTRGTGLQKGVREPCGIPGSSTVLAWLRRHGRQAGSGQASWPPMTTAPETEQPTQTPDAVHRASLATCRRQDPPRHRCKPMAGGVIHCRIRTCRTRARRTSGRTSRTARRRAARCRSDHRHRRR